MFAYLLGIIDFDLCQNVIYHRPLNIMATILSLGYHYLQISLTHDE